jgi:hypothetical protein
VGGLRQRFRLINLHGQRIGPKRLLDPPINCIINHFSLWQIDSAQLYRVAVDLSRTRLGARAMRGGWRRQPGNDGKSRVLITADVVRAAAEQPREQRISSARTIPTLAPQRVFRLTPFLSLAHRWPSARWFCGRGVRLPG